MPIDVDLQVLTGAGDKGEQEPRTLVVDGERLEVLGIDDRWHDPDALYFRVLASNGCKYLVRCDAKDSSWSLVRTWMLES